ncbi:MAG: Histidine kinase [Promethearchaeota archaeon]|nr:MAG: Histidine kinase [Candidatus Lokiarchaeota archaeon]
MTSILQEIMQGANRLEKTIKNLIECSKLDQNLVEIQKSKTNLKDTIIKCIKDFENFAHIRNQSIKVELHDNLSVYCDNKRINEAFSNLFMNAIKFTPPDGFIRVYSQKTKEDVIISIQDSGIGFTKKEQERIFKKFGKIERYGKGFDLDIEGSGLGLYMAKRIIELHDGKIWLESKGRNKGSTFNFSLPIHPE